MPDGLLLTHPKYEKLLLLNRRIAFLSRIGLVSDVIAPISWKGLITVQLQLTRWLTLYATEFQPSEYGFKLVDQSGLESLMLGLASGGWTNAHRLPERLLEKFYQQVFGAECPRELLERAYQLPLDVRTPIIKWFKENGYYGKVVAGVNIGKSYLLREKLERYISGYVEASVKSAKFNAFCRQFEPEFQNTTLLIGIHQFTERPSHKTREIVDVLTDGAAENSLKWVSNCITNILSAHRHLPDLLPEPSLVSVRRAQALAVKLTRQSAHTDFIPVNVGLAYFNCAMKFVHLYGGSIIDFYLAVISEPRETTGASIYASLDEQCGGDFSRRFTVACKDTVVPIGEILGITQFRRPCASVDFELLRRAPTLVDALRILIGACIVCIGFMKPSREDELTHLKRDCLCEDGDGYQLRFTGGKSNSGEAYQDKDRPIPVIAAKAVQLLQKLGAGLSTVFGHGNKFEGNLFYLPNERVDGALAADKGLLNAHLDVFCDYVGLEADDKGRRWYVRIHEMRKWFLLLLFWSGKFEVLDAARWIAGHTNSSHIHAYLALEFPGEELPRLEAEYAVSRLRLMESMGGRSSESDVGLDILYDEVLNHFKVQSLSLIPNSEWTDYVLALRLEEGFYIKPHSIFGHANAREVVGMNVSFVLRESINE